MAQHYFTAGRKFRRRSIIKLPPEERNAVTERDRVTARYPVEWPLPDYLPDFAAASVDQDGTEIWGQGPYLKVPNRQGDDVQINRVFGPWGYPPDRVRIARTKIYLEIVDVNLTRLAPVEWEWRIGLRLITEGDFK